MKIEQDLIIDLAMKLLKLESDNFVRIPCEVDDRGYVNLYEGKLAEDFEIKKDDESFNICNIACFEKHFSFQIKEELSCTIEIAGSKLNIKAYLEDKEIYDQLLDEANFDNFFTHVSKIIEAAEK